MPHRFTEDDVASISRSRPTRHRKERTPTSKAKGVITAIVYDKGYGFCRTPACTDDVFFHHTSLIDKNMQFDDLRDGDEIRFKLIHTPKGYRAIDVELALPIEDMALPF